MAVSTMYFGELKDSLSYGVTDVAYSRVMLIGNSGVGKTSLIRGLQHKLYNPNRSSTVVAKVQQLMPESRNDVISRDWVGHKWGKVTEKDELEELSQLIAAVNRSEQHHSDPSPSNMPLLHNDTPIITNELKKMVNSDIIDEAVKRAILIDKGKIERKLECLPFYNVWDCGGQPVFLEVLPAFSTSHTMFLPLFDASKSVHDKLQSMQYFKGQGIPGEILNISSVELMEGWMSTVHAHLFKRDDKNVPLGYPRVLPVGTRGDQLKKKDKEEVLKELDKSFEGKAFREILKEPLIIDNTTAGTDTEDPSYQRIRDEIFKFTTEELKKPTPITWVLFRRLIQLVVAKEKKNVLSLNEAKLIASFCKINEADVSSVVRFYHELGVVLNYPHIEGLKNTIILSPKWFVECLGKILALEGREESQHEMKDQWKLLRDKGILVQPLYETVWSQYKEITPDAIMKLLVSLQLAVEIHTNEFHCSSVKQFFVPAVLPYTTTSYQQPINDIGNSAAPLHITFMEQYVVPGYFIRLIAVMQNSPHCSLSFDHPVFHDQVSFRFGDSGASLVTLEQTSRFIAVHFFNLQNSLSPAIVQKNCRSLKKVLSKSCEEVEKCLHVSRGNVKQYERLRVVCEAVSCHSHPIHYLFTQPSGSEIACEKSALKFRELSLPEAYWFTIKDGKVNSVTLKSVYDCLKTVSHRWDDIGRELGVPFSFRKGLKKEGIMTTNEEKLEEVLNNWIESQSTPVAWETITDMLPNLGLNNIADEIIQQ